MSNLDFLQSENDRREAEAQASAQEAFADSTQPGETIQPWRYGVAKIVANSGSGAYTITEQYLDSSGVWQACSVLGFVAATAYDFQLRTTGTAGDTVVFWQTSKGGGTSAYLIDVGDAASVEIPAAMVIWRAAESTPTGYLPCDGAAVSRTTYASLFAVISTDFGVGDGSTTFNVPNVEGRVIVCKDSADAVLSVADAIGETGGAETIDVGHTHDTGSMSESFTDDLSANAFPAPGGGQTTAATWDTGSDEQSVVQPFITMYAYIKT